MQVSVEATTGLERRMTVEVPGERVEQEVRKRLENLGRTTRIKGFRPGKVPFKVIQQRYGDQVHREVVGELIQASFYEAVGQEKLRPAGAPSIEPKSLEPGKSIEFTAVFEVFPQVEPASPEGVRIDKPVAEVTDADVEQLIDTLRKQRTEWEPVDRAAAEGDRVTLDFEGTIEGEPFEGNKGQNVPVTLGAGQMIEGFEQGLIGAKAGEQRTLDLNFPEEYPHKTVAGKPVRFEATVSKVEAPKLPELDEAFIKSFGVEAGTEEAFRAEVRQNMERELEQKIASKLKQTVMDKLLEINPIEVPKALVDSEAENLAEQMRRNLRIPAGKQGVNLDKSMFEEQARRRVVLGLILAEIVQSEGLKPEPEKVRETVEKLAASYEDPKEVVDWYYADKRNLSEVESLVLEERVVEWVMEKADVADSATTFEELMKQQS